MQGIGRLPTDWEQHLLAVPFSTAVHADQGAHQSVGSNPAGDEASARPLKALLPSNSAA